MEAGGHRGAFHADEAERQRAGLMSLVPQVVNAVSVLVMATGGIADARAIAAALLLRASAVIIGTAVPKRRPLGLKRGLQHSRERGAKAPLFHATVRAVMIHGCGETMPKQ